MLGSVIWADWPSDCWYIQIVVDGLYPGCTDDGSEDAK